MSPSSLSFLFCISLCFTIVLAAETTSVTSIISSLTTFWATSSLNIRIAIISSIVISIFFFYRILASSGSGRVQGVFGILNNKDHINSKEQFSSIVDSYSALHGETSGVDHEQLLEKRKADYTSMVNAYYDLATDFYEYGWGESFHFAPRWKGESFLESIHRAEHYLVGRIGGCRGMKIVDVGCGIGGPMRTIARHSGANVTGINNNAYQIKVGTRKNAAVGLAKQCDFIKADFLHIPVADGTFDAAYAIEATCHSPSKEAIYGEIYRILKPGGLFGCYEWVMTDKYDEKNPVHVGIRQGIEVGNSIPHLDGAKDVIKALKAVGYEILDNFDANEHGESDLEIPWYRQLDGTRWSLENFRLTWLGRTCTWAFVNLLEILRIAPKGTTAVSQILDGTVPDLVNGGRLGVFTPSYFFLVRKPLNATATVSAPVTRRASSKKK